MSDRAELVALARKGERQAFAELVRRYRPLVFSICFERTGNWDDSEDLTQEVFVAAYRNLASVREPEEFPAWLRGIAMNMLKTRARRAVPTAVAGEQAEPASDEWATLGKSVEWHDLLYRALSNIPTSGREIVSLHYFGGYSYKEIATITSVPEKVVKSRLYEARNQLKTRLLQTVAELCRCTHEDSHAVQCIMERCGTEACECVGLLRGD